MPKSSFFTGRVAVIATMHRKETVITPLVEAALGVTTLVPAEFDTNCFGTFTREIKRPADQLTTARLKAEAALDLTGETLAISSEGSFGPHPQMPFIASNLELVLLRDRQQQLEIVGEHLSTKTNYQSQTVHTLEDALSFAESVGFPDHGLVVMPSASRNSPDSVFKGITTEARLVEAFTLTLEQSPNRKVHIETDMRALYNPTRMEAIAQATEDLIRVTEQRCPQCDRPGFRIVKHEPGLPCGLCGTPTLLTLSVLYRCQSCQFEQRQHFPDSLQFADPGQCPYCNP